MVAQVPTVSDFEVVAGDGSRVPLARKAGKVLLIVNTASRCGLTPQYNGLEALWQRFNNRDFEILAFPCNQFGHQEPESDALIATFCDLHFGLSFPLMAKIEVNGPSTIPLYQWLKSEAPGLLGTPGIKWNFTKFLIGRDGRVVRRYAPAVTPSSLRRAIEALL